MAQFPIANGSARTDPTLAFVPRVGRGWLDDVSTESHRSFPIPTNWSLLSQKKKFADLTEKSQLLHSAKHTLNVVCAAICYETDRT